MTSSIKIAPPTGASCAQLVLLPPAYFQQAVMVTGERQSKRCMAVAAATADWLRWGSCFAPLADLIGTIELGV